MTNASSENRIPLTDKMLELLTMLDESREPMLFGDPANYSCALALVRRGLVFTVPLKINGAVTRGFMISIAGRAILANRRAEGVAS